MPKRAAGDSTFACRRDRQLAVAHARVLAVYAPFGDKRPFFRARVDGQEAAQQPAEQGLVQVEQIKMEEVRLQQVEMAQQQTTQQQAGTKPVSLETGRILRKDLARDYICSYSVTTFVVNGVPCLRDRRFG
ncbi:hypothetical protein [Xanthomonas bonasiae]|uniref:hypothetical protein n=1 Tax=Xanthomonas bonasiae TaxID=2810351 RepID=UPI0019807637|nr:hypothetical protein [Xanthomonas bonasiae]MBN6111532.1 hypothetical protein [Xanthomonas bonasiae]